MNGMPEAIVQYWCVYICIYIYTYIDLGDLLGRLAWKLCSGDLHT